MEAGKLSIFPCMKKNLFSMAVLFALFISCSNSSNIEEDSSSTIETPSYLNQMLLVEGNPSKVPLGTNNKNALASEKPQMNVILDYDFYMDVHEVTCGDYAAVLKALKFNAPECQNDSLPMVDVTYNDAVLWANAKSKLANIDTVYDYTETTFDEDGHCTNISGLVLHLERKGFRLPTEAEWIKAASIDWDSTNSWNNSNSDYKLHNVCSRDQKPNQFCDLAGNALEWVNDWLGNFKDTTVTNYVGAPDGGNLGERILKGGAFNINFSSINRYSRGDVYTVTSSTHAEYAGFRLAFGAIDSPLWMTSDGKAQESIINTLASPTEIHHYTKSYNVKLAFRNDETSNLAFIDYSAGAAAVIEIDDTISVYHPEISPDGNHVAFCTTLEGLTGKSSLYVRDLNKEGTNLVKLDVQNAAIPRWRVLDSRDTVITYVTNAGVNQDSATWKTYSTWQVPFSDGKFGKPVKLFDGSFHGGISDDNRLAVTGARLLRAKVADDGETLTSNATDEVWYNGEQACNASLAQDNSKRTAFLDFASKTGKDFVGKSYKVHERLFIADSTGTLKQSVGAPDGYTFDHTEWAVGDVKDNLVATLTNADGAHKRITLVNTSDSTTLDLAEGEELWHPCLWIQKNAITFELNDTATALDEFKLDPDSAGIYYTSSGDYIAAQWRYKMEILWEYKDSANVVILGSSRGLLGLNPLMFNEPFFAINLANTSNINYGSKFLFHNYVIPHVKNLKYIIISMDIDRWYHDDNYCFFYSTYKSYPGYVYDENHNFWIDDVPKYLFEATYQSLGHPNYESRLREGRGYQYTTTSGWEQESVPIHKDSTWLEKSDKVFNKSYQYLIDIVTEANEHGITVIGVELPESPAYKYTGAYGKYGIKRSQMPMIFEKIQQIHEQHPNFIFVDENKMGDHDYTDDMAQNADHLAPLGADLVSTRLDSILRTLPNFRE